MSGAAVLGSPAVTLRRSRESCHRALRWLSAVGLLWAVVLASAFSGRSLGSAGAWCPRTDEICTERCADAPEPGGADESEHGATFAEPSHADHAVGELPDARRREASRLAETPPFALLPSVPIAPVPRFAALPAASAVRPAARRAPPRAGPHSASARCAALQVFHC